MKKGFGWLKNIFKMIYQLFLLHSIKTVLVLQILILGVIGQLPQPNVTLGKDGICIGSL